MGETVNTTKRSKRDEILETAGKLFVENGFQAVSVDQIAAAVPVSKPTLYAHFEDKRALFVAVISQRCQKALTSLQLGIERQTTPEDQLTAFATQFVELLLSKQALQLHRVMIGESESFPDMAQTFYETGPQKMHEFLMHYLADVDKHGLLRIPDPSLSADIFLGMIKGRMHLKCLLGVNKEEVGEKERQTLIKTAVGIFLTGHAV